MSERTLTGALTRYRVMAYVVGVWLIVLVLVAMPLKYLDDSPTMVEVVGPVHGFLYMAYLVTAVDLARASREYRLVGQGGQARHRATFHSTDAEALRDLFAIVGRLDACDVLIDGRPVPHARELWLPLVWFLLPR